MVVRAQQVRITAVLAFAVGVTLSIGALLVWRSLDLDEGAYSKTEPGATLWRCSGADVLATAVLDEGKVQVVVSLHDDQRRTWEVRVRWGSGVVSRRPTTDGTYPVVWQESGDLDDGHVRYVAARVDGTRAWCRRAVSLT